MIIETTSDLEAVCRRFAAYPYITIDTEFLREKTYYPVLCLVQIASPDEAFCIDPLAPDMDLSALFELLQNENVVKVFHAARQDIEIFLHLSGKIPTPIFDTQIGAMVCGFGENAAYSQLVQAVTNVTLDKSMRCTNWAKRPLTPAQIQYALYDVTYLRDVYVHLQSAIQKSGRLSWVQSELDFLSDKSTYEPSPQELIERINCPVSKAVNIRAYQRLYLWREQKAQEKDRPRRYILKDDLLQELALLLPKTPEQIKGMRGVSNHFEKSDMAKEILNVIQRSLEEPIKDIHIVKPPKPLNKAEKNLLEVLKLALTLVAIKEKVAPVLIAHTDDLIQFIRQQKSPLQTGWRYEVFGQTADKIRSGKIGITYNPKTKKAELIEIAQKD